MARQKVAVIGGSAMWRRGVGAVLADAGFDSTDEPILLEWQPGRGVSACLVFVGSADGVDDLQTATDDHPNLPFVAVTPALGVAEVASIVRAGAVSALDENDDPATLVEVVCHAIAGRTSLSVPIARALATRISAGFGEMLRLEEHDARRIQALAAGTTVARLADGEGYSEREMFRLLNGLYERIGVRTRTEAILWAARYGVLDDG